MPRVAAPLGRIATLSRESVDAMGDIVWAIDPHRDTPTHLAQRMRRLASDLLSARGIEVRFEIADASHPRLGADVRREVFLIFKEALHNITRHAQATRVEIVSYRSRSAVWHWSSRTTAAASIQRERATARGFETWRGARRASAARWPSRQPTGTGARLGLTVPL